MNLKNNSNAQTIQKGASILLFSTVIAKIIGALFKIPLSSDFCLGDLGFGYFSAAHDIHTPFCTLAISGFPVAISKMIADFVAKKRYDQVEKVFSTARKLLFWAGVLSASALAVFAFYLMDTDRTGKTIYSIMAIVPSVLFGFVASVYRGYYEGLCNMTPPAISGIIEALGKLILGFGLAYITILTTKDVAIGSAAALFGISVGEFISMLYLHFKYKAKKKREKQNDQNLKFDNTIAKMLIILAIPAVLSSLSGSFVAFIDSLTVRYQLSEMLADTPGVIRDIYSSLIDEYNKVFASPISNDAIPTLLYGIKSKAFTLYNLVPTLTAAIGVGAIPVIAGGLACGDYESVKQGVGNTVKLSAIISFPAGLGFLAISGRIMSLLYGAGVSADLGGRMLCLYGLAAVFSGLSVPLGCLILAFDRKKALLRNVLIGLGIKIAVNLLLSALPRVNIFGAILGTVICFFVIFVLHFITLLKAIGGFPNIRQALLKPLISAAVCALFAYLITFTGSSNFVTFLAVSVAAVIYLAVLLLLKVFNEADILAIPAGEKLIKPLKMLKLVS